MISRNNKAEAGHDIRFTSADFRRIRQLAYEHAGIALNDSKQHMVYTRLAKQVRTLQLKSFADYLDGLEGNDNDVAWQVFINALTTNLTFFFREPHHFDMLAEHARLYGRMHRGEKYRVWSAASSTGEEPYSIAMTLLECFDYDHSRFEVVASDIDTQVLTKARGGVYPVTNVEKLSRARLKQFFLRGKGDNQGRVKVKPALAQAVSFVPFNLTAQDWSKWGAFDVIFCRNVFIYFDKPTQRSILEHFASHLHGHGMLLLGHSENIQYVTSRFEPCGRTAYRLTPA